MIASFSFKYEIAISQPCFANSMATALPIPLSPPVIKATLSFRLLPVSPSLLSNIGYGVAELSEHGCLS